jgi:hypothetical protein
MTLSVDLPLVAHETFTTTCISAIVLGDETASYAINPQKEEKSRRIDRSTQTPIKT